MNPQLKYCPERVRRLVACWLAAGLSLLTAVNGWRPSKDWEFSLVGQNLLEPAHPEFSTQFSAPLPKEMERSAYAKITWHF